MVSRLALASVALSAFIVLSSACSSSISDDGAGGDGGSAKCNAVPTCDDQNEEVAVSKCDPEPGQCRKVSVCGTTIFCEQLHCGVEPTCRPNEVFVNGCPHGNGVECQTRESCGGTIQCASCPGLACDDGDTTAPLNQCISGSTCYDVHGCGLTLVCMRSDPTKSCPDAEPSDGDTCNEAPAGTQCTYGPCDVLTCTDHPDGADDERVWSRETGCGGEGAGGGPAP